MSLVAKILHDAFADTYARIGELLDSLAEAQYRIKELELAVKTQEANAKIGELVRGMRQHTSLRCIARGYYSSRTHLFAGSRIVRTTVSAAEPLRSIQEVSDAED